VRNRYALAPPSLPGRGQAGRGVMGKMVRGRSNGLEAGGRAVSSTLAALVAVLIIVAGAVLSLVILAYFTSVAVQGADVERLAQKSRETVKLAIGYEVVKDEEGVKYLTKMQLKNAWSGTTEITYAVVLDRQGRVMYEREFNPPLTLYASEVKFMKPSELVPELAIYDGDWWRMWEEVGLIVLHTKLGNRFTSFYEMVGAPTVVKTAEPSVTTIIVVFTTKTQTITEPTTTTITQVTSTTGTTTTTLTDWTIVTVGTVTSYETDSRYFTQTITKTRKVWAPPVTVTIPDQTVTVTNTVVSIVQGGTATVTITSTSTAYLSAPAVTNTVTVTYTKTSTFTSWITEEVRQTLTTILWIPVDIVNIPPGPSGGGGSGGSGGSGGGGAAPIPIASFVEGVMETLRVELIVPIGAVILLGMPDRLYRYVKKNWKMMVLALAALSIASIYLTGMGVANAGSSDVTITSTSTVTVTSTTTTTITSTTTVTSTFGTTITRIITLTISEYDTVVYIVSPTTVYLTSTTVRCDPSIGGCYTLTYTTGSTVTYVTRPQPTVVTTVRITETPGGGVATYYTGGNIVTVTVTVTSVSTKAPTTVTATAYTTVTSTTGGTTITETSTSWNVVAKTTTFTTTVTYYPCVIFLGINLCYAAPGLA